MVSKDGIVEILCFYRGIELLMECDGSINSKWSNLYEDFGFHVKDEM